MAKTTIVVKSKNKICMDVIDEFFDKTPAQKAADKLLTFL